jgi:hypothetical protein
MTYSAAVCGTICQKKNLGLTASYIVLINNQGENGIH